MDRRRGIVRDLSPSQPVPPLHGRLRCANVAVSDSRWASELAFGLPGGINFRSETSGVGMVNKYWTDVRVPLRNSLYAFPRPVRSRYLIRSAQPRLNVPTRAPRVIRTGPVVPVPIPGEHVTPVHRTPYPILRLAQAGRNFPLDNAFYNRASHSVNSYSSWIAPRPSLPNRP